MAEPRKMTIQKAKIGVKSLATLVAYCVRALDLIHRGEREIEAETETVTETETNLSMNQTKNAVLGK